MALTLKLNGSNYVSEKTRGAFVEAIENPESRTEKREARSEKREAQYDSQLLQSHSAAEYARVLEHLENGLAQSYQHQHETLRVHEQYLSYQAEYSRIFLQLMQQQSALFSNGAAQSEAMLSVVQTLARSIEQFHQHQTETLGVHNQFLSQQAVYSQAFVELLQQQVGGKPANRRISDGQPQIAVNQQIENPESANQQPSELICLQSTFSNPQSIITQPSNHLIVQPSDPDPITRDSQPITTKLPDYSTIQPSIPLTPELLPPKTTQPSNSQPATHNLQLVTTEFSTPSLLHSSIPLTSELLSTALLAIVSEKTGYPVEMLELEMDMEADLGIDSIKRVEILGTLQDQYPDLPEIETDVLGELRTLGQVVDYTIHSPQPVLKKA
ncbi:MAG: hypothetical protein JXA33_05400 [Anaerolineae bacterium]|nr:hypothetical protein [Anaerolineae bacterium]